MDDGYLIRTLLMTDVVGSTRLWSNFPDAMPGVIERLEELAEGAVSAEGGELVKRRGEGDSLFCVMPHPAAAARAAVALMRQLSLEAWPEGVDLRVRAAVHCGRAYGRGGDLFGQMPNRCARLREVGHGGQVLLSGAAKAQLSLHDGITTIDLGRHRLRDLDESEAVYQVVVDDLPAEFPPLRSLTSLRNNLPLQLTSFVGRVGLRESLVEGLASHRLTTLTGAGGSGKTRLALQIAADSIDAFSDGVWYAELANTTTDAGVIRAIADACGYRDLPDSADERPLVDRFRGREVCLLVLDNAEQALGPIGRVANALLGALPGLTVIVTSREPLRLRGERVVRVEPLTVPAVGADDAETVAASEAGSLFLDRATLHLPEFAINRTNASAIASILRRVDGIPLCLEMAAAHVGYLSPAEIASRLDDRFALLEGVDAGAPPRHRTMRETIAWQYDTLAPEERRLLQRLAVFVGGFSLEAAEAVAEGPGVLRLVRALVEKSLVVAHPDGAGTRYRLLETIGQFAAEQPEKETEAALPALFGWAARTAEEGYAGMGSGEREEFSRRLDLASGSILRALQWGLEGGDPRSIRLTLDMTRYWLYRGRYVEARKMLEMVRSLAQPGVERAEVWNVLGVFQNRLGDAVESEKTYRLALSEPGLTDTIRHRCLTNLAITLVEAGSYDEATLLYGEALELASVLADPAALNATRLNRALLMLALERWNEAALEYQDLGRIYRSLNDSSSASNCDIWLALAHFRLGNLDAAAEALITALAEAGPDPRAEFFMDVWLVAAAIAFRQGNSESGSFLLGGHEFQRGKLGMAYAEHDRRLWQEIDHLSELDGKLSSTRTKGRGASHAELLNEVRSIYRLQSEQDRIRA